MRIFTGRDDVLTAVGETLGSSDWLTISQERVNLFAEATGDHQWIHVDVERATRESQYGGPIAHGYLTLSLIPLLGTQIYRFEAAKMGVNYGSDKVRFPAPVRVGSRVRSTAVLTAAAEQADGSLQAIVTHTIETSSSAKPAVVAECVTRVYW